MIFFNTGASAYFNMSDETMTWVFMLLLVGGALYYLGQDDKPVVKNEDGSVKN